jgi:hypothetical protein
MSEKSKKAEKTESEQGPKWAEAIKKVASVGIGAAFLTEDVLKSVLSDIPLPKDMLNGLLSNAKTAKAEFVEMVKQEVHQVLEKVDVKAMLREVLEEYDMDVQAKITFTKKKVK